MPALSAAPNWNHLRHGLASAPAQDRVEAMQAALADEAWSQPSVPGWPAVAFAVANTLPLTEQREAAFRGLLERGADANALVELSRPDFGVPAFQVPAFFLAQTAGELSTFIRYGAEPATQASNGLGFKTWAQNRVQSGDNARDILARMDVWFASHYEPTPARPHRMKP